MEEPQPVTEEPESRFLSLPKTSVGKWSARLLPLSVALILLNAVVFMPMTEQRAELEQIQAGINLAIGLCIVVSGMTGLYAFLAQGERSWAVFVAILLFGLAVALNFAP